MSYKKFVLNKLNTSATQTYLQESVDNLIVVDNQHNLSSRNTSINALTARVETLEDSQ